MHSPSAFEWKTTTEAAVDGWKGLLRASSSLAAEKAGKSAGSSLSVTLPGRAGSRDNRGATMQWDSRHSGFTLKTAKKNKNKKKMHKSRGFALLPADAQAPSMSQS